MKSTNEIFIDAKAAKASLGAMSDEKLNEALRYIADELISGADYILSENKRDIEKAESDGKIKPVMIDRLRLTRTRINDMAKGILAVASLPSPIGRVLYENIRENELNIKKISVPFGVIGIIYESRPNVTSDAAALCLKSGNVCILRGGKEAYQSAHAIVECIKRGLARAGISENAVNLIEDTSRQSAHEMMTATGYIDLLIPRGSQSLISACIANATVPCVQTGTGICHIYIDGSADLDMAVKILNNAKTSRPSVCNAAEVALIDRTVIDDAAAKIYDTLVLQRLADGLQPVELRCDTDVYAAITKKYGNSFKYIVAADDGDFDCEFLDYILALRAVDGVHGAVAHIDSHSTHHSETIIAEDKTAQDIFTLSVDSAAVYVNASTRFTDGGEFGFGCEMGISTQKCHPRGPMGLPELTTYKYIICGNGQIR